MLVGSACFDPNNGVSETHMKNCSPSFPIEDQQREEDAAAMEMKLQTDSDNLMQQMVHDQTNQILSCDQTSWEQPMTFGYHHQPDIQHLHLMQPAIDQMQNVQHQINSFTNPLMSETSNQFPPTSDLVNMIPLPRCSASTNFLSNPSAQMSSNFLGSLGLIGDISAADGAISASSVVFDPVLPLSLPPQVQPPLLRELLQSLPHGYNLGGSRGGSSLFGEVDNGDGSSGFFQDGENHLGIGYGNGVFEFTEDMSSLTKVGKGKHAKHFATEKQRRVQFSDKYTALKSLIPHPTKSDRASIVGDAIDYINELRRTVTELKILVEKKRCSKERRKRMKEDTADGSVNVKTEDDLDQPFHGLRSSWLHRKSKNTEVDVRIIEDEVTVKLVQQKRINCLLYVSKVLDELELDLHHVAGGLIGDYYSFLFNSKICEGSTVYAHAIANKLIEVVDKHYTAAHPTSSY